jgi:F-type H+-transporting ATPase subunit a
MNFFSPLEQFDLVFLFRIFEYDVVNINIFCSLVGFFIFFLIFFFVRYLFFVSIIQQVFELLYFSIIEMLIQQAGVESIQYFSYIFFVFLFILFNNLIGMLPFSFTLTAHLSLTFFLAFSFNFFFLFLGIYEHGSKFLYVFIPKGAPFLLLPLIMVIEIVSYLIRTFSLSIRLFANMMSGHCLLFVISSFVFKLVSISLYMYIPIISIYICVFLLEFAIAFLQAYVFTILLCIYLKDSLHPGH